MGVCSAGGVLVDIPVEVGNAVEVLPGGTSVGVSVAVDVAVGVVVSAVPVCTPVALADCVGIADAVSDIVTREPVMISVGVTPTEAAAPGLEGVGEGKITDVVTLFTLPAVAIGPRNRDVTHCGMVGTCT